MSQNLVSSANLLLVHFAPSCRSLMKELNRIGPTIDLWGTLLVTGLQLDFMSTITTLSVYAFSHFSIHLTVYSYSPYFISFSTGILQKTMSKAILKSG